MNKFMAFFAIVFILIGGYMSFFSKEQLPINLFATLQGTVTSMNSCGNDVYMTVRSRPTGTDYFSMENSYARIVKVSKNDFILRDVDKFDVVLHIENDISASTLAHNGSEIYFILRKAGKITAKAFFYKFNIETLSTEKIADYNSAGGMLENIDGKYFLDVSDSYVAIGTHDCKKWYSPFTNLKKKIITCAENGDIYYILDNKLWKIAKESIIKGDFFAEVLCEAAPDLVDGYLFVDTDKNAYASACNDKKCSIVNVKTNERIPITRQRFLMSNAYLLASIVYKHEQDFYCVVRGANSPFSREARIVKVSGDRILETTSFSGRPRFLGTLDDYLIFNLDSPFERKSYVFGIKYK